MPGDHFTRVAVHVQQVTILKETAGMSNAHCGRYATFARERGGVLKNRAFLDDESGDSREQWSKMWMKDAHNENSTCRNGHDVFGVAYNMRFPAGTSRRSAEARVGFR